MRGRLEQQLVELLVVPGKNEHRFVHWHCQRPGKIQLPHLAHVGAGSESRLPWGLSPTSIARAGDSYEWTKVRSIN
jgi:hypothetical protein